MNEYSQQVNNEGIEVFIGDIHNERKILFEIRKDFVEDFCEFEVILSYINIDNNKVLETDKALLKVVNSKEELNKFDEDKEIINRVISLVNYPHLLR